MSKLVINFQSLNKTKKVQNEKSCKIKNSTRYNSLPEFNARKDHPSTRKSIHKLNKKYKNTSS